MGFFLRSKRTSFAAYSYNATENKSSFFHKVACFRKDFQDSLYLKSQKFFMAPAHKVSLPKAQGVLQAAS